MEDLQYVGFWARFWASVVDVILLMMIIYPLFYLIYGDAFIEKAADFSFINNVVGYILPFMAILIFWHYKSATPGKMLLKAKIVDVETLEKPTMKQYVIRNFAYLISFIPFGLGYLWAGWDAKKQTWHDKLAHTVVVQPKKEQKPKSIGSYIAIGFGVFAIGIFTVILTLGMMIQTGIMPDGDLYDQKKLPSHVSVALTDKNVLEESETILYYQPEGTFSFTNSGIVFTNETIRYFETDEQDEVLLWDFPLNKIGKLVLNVESFTLGIEIITMEIYDDAGEMEFIVGLTPVSGQSASFKKEIMELWKNARKD